MSVQEAVERLNALCNGNSWRMRETDPEDLRTLLASHEALREAAEAIATGLWTYAPDETGGIQSVSIEKTEYEALVQAYKEASR